MLYRFGDFELDLDRIELRAQGSGERIALEPQVFALLALLVDARDRMVSKDEIFEKIWDGRIVTDSALASRVKYARQALGDDGRSQRFIRTVHGRGFQFVADVRIAASTPPATSSRRRRRCSRSHRTPGSWQRRTARRNPGSLRSRCFRSAWRAPRAIRTR